MGCNGTTVVAEICALVKEGSVLSAAETENGIAKSDSRVNQGTELGAVDINEILSTKSSRRISGS